MAELPGVELAALARWLDAERPGLRQGELSGEVIAGGKSNLTYRITDGVSTWALRRPPLAHVLPTAHDMVREFTVISALADTRVPVAPAIALCTDADVLGAQFYVMGFVDGVVLDKPKLLSELEAAAATRSCELLLDTLVDLHEIEPDSVGLAEFGRPDGFLARQVRRWHQQWQASETRPLDALGQTVERLTETLPEQSAPAIVHGDYRLTNVMFTPDLGRIAAVVDWEMATLGDPLTDLGLLYVYHQLAGAADSVMPDFPAEQGFLGPRQLLDRYAERTGESLADLDWYIAFGYYKLAVIAAGIHARYLQGKTVGSGFEVFGRLRDSTLAAAADRLSS
jgi:aminoglycoside phosphotransferase (APT) family kinase protein